MMKRAALLSAALALWSVFSGAVAVSKTDMGYAGADDKSTLRALAPTAESDDCNSNLNPDSDDITLQPDKVLFSEDFEGNQFSSDWIVTGGWRLAKSAAEDEQECIPEIVSDTPTQAAALNRKPDGDDPKSCTYDFGGRVRAALTLATPVRIPRFGAYLTWANFIMTEGLPVVDQWFVEVSANNGTTWEIVYDGEGRSTETWEPLQVDLSQYAEKRILVRFRFDSRDGLNNNFLGWYIDDVKIISYFALSYDENSNGIPDDCEEDCNSNGIVDDVDLTRGISQDCNSNNIPDECEVTDQFVFQWRFDPTVAEEFTTKIVTLTGGLPPLASTPVKLHFYGYGLYGRRAENSIDVYINNSNFGSVQLPLAQSPCGYGFSDLVLEANAYNGALNFTQNLLKLIPGESISPRCESSFLEVTLSYGYSTLAKDCNGNGVPDECDLGNGTSSDCNGNSVPDECDLAEGTSPDCNNNNVPDECDLLSGTSYDCNANDVLDECDIAQRTSLDCNSNGVPDECDLESGASADCNVDGIPDECDILEGISQDLNDNIVPDECEFEYAVGQCGGDLSVLETLWFDNFENPAANLWTTGTITGACTWSYPPPSGFENPFSGQLNAFGGHYPIPSDSWLAMRDFVQLPAEGVITLTVKHAYDFEYGFAYRTIYEGGVIEYLVEGSGSGWQDAGPLMTANGYRGTINLTYGNPLGGRNAFGGTSNGYITTRLDLTALAGKRIKIRFRVGTDVAVASGGWSVDDVRITRCYYGVEEQVQNDFPTGAGWSEFVRIPDATAPGYAETDVDSANTALRARVSASPDRYRIVGWFTNASNWLPYSVVGPDRYVRGKFYVYATGQTNPSQINSIPNLRMRLANRFAVSSILEVHHHVGAAAGDEPVTSEVRPSTDPERPSLYRVDFDPVDVPYLIGNPYTEGILRAFEAYSFEPQDNGYICLTESSIGVYPKSIVTPTSAALMWRKTYEVADLNPFLPNASWDLYSLDFSAVPSGQGYVPPRDIDFTPEIIYSATTGVTVDSTSLDNRVDGRYLVGIATLDFDPGSDLAQRVRVEENKQYMVRFHVTSTQQSNLNPQMRCRARTLRFGWAQKYEVGGAWAINTPAHSTIAAQALPGIGCLNPDKIGPFDFRGGWYTLIMHSPMNVDIRPELSGPLAVRMPNLSAQPGPGVAAPSLRDLKVGFDLIDTMSGSVNADLEAGNFTLDRIEIYSYDLIPD
ncbi:MAG: immune inhibitor A [Candidatus Sumerlaea chitinivorans]|jgi:hypothetical protein|uniref:Zinc metalloproteinase n=1 Tax=Sumerlaea chitinivorans TaxID=2250252 RepID=A0A2Z4Y7E2_SUMC1|nr:Zinc metalloproteinase precursor [Candidatus Sumerlaea chitinivorans]MCX7964370.1 immune inhibitor A [Candidatus Sumerlaea chitinivorans]